MMTTRTLFTAVASAALALCACALSAAPARAAAAQNPDMSNPAIKKIVDARIARTPSIDKYKATGVLGENNQAMLEIRDVKAVTDPKDREAVEKLVYEENNDRRQQFAETAKQQKVDVAKIQEDYAQKFRDRAKAGEWVQLQDGVWKKK